MSIDRSGDASQSVRVHEFGKFQDNHGWVQCQSKTYPDRVYFYNTNSRCSTWYRPISRYVDIPSMKRRVTSSDDITMDELELMSVSDNEQPAKRNGDKSLITASKSIMARYYTSWLASISDDSCETFATTRTNESLDRETDSMSDQSRKPRGRTREENNNSSDNYNDNAKGKVDVESAALPIFESSELDNDDAAEAPLAPSRHSCVMHGVPRLMKINLEHQVVGPVRKIRAVRKPRRVTTCERVPKLEERKIISDVYGVKTISYDLPDPEQMSIRAGGVGARTSRLTDSDSDDSEPPPRAETTKRFLEPDIGQNTQAPLLSDSSSPSSRSSTSNSTACSTCSTCSTCNSEV
ncbi:uncharacterized protein LOC105274893 isoform X1 [Ooceraea biroi]|nr:uncharacterized protein LOC105274893 isoform X1 [Ooceraea biroi]EZA59851.1 hypothetical protein X777_16053 [Ooceraea biroi]